MKYCKNYISDIAKDESGLAFVEFAVSLPVFLGLGMYGSETSYLALTNLKLSQSALNLADNGSRLGQTDNGVATPVIKESDVLEILYGTKLQSGKNDFMENGRFIIASLEVKTVSNGSGGTKEQQFVGWRRCKGKKVAVTKYNDDVDGNGVTDSGFNGMGDPANPIQAVSGSAVIFVEAEFDYQPLFGDLFHKNKKLRQEASFNIRDDRNLSAGLFGDVASSKRAYCNKYDDTFT
ncbi:hypothetical protein LPB140_07960 [Sphingorhabdus lutea]|uniref:Pilus assembly protein n=1 Tax=Sphingorhabdus lutea TaxID=1913578 RepID=A0A1L3JEZ5_9SPHN|nr:hypothetical protein [Sphingorhabdus lutea]APG63705.1 hypothetical protein LPB140_07960 [Sphingorhabdus lutea]